MKINRRDDIIEKAVDMEGAKDVTIKILVGPDDGSNNIIMRYFKVLPGGHTPRHIHIQEHIARIQKGKGIVLDGKGNENEVSSGDSVYVPSNEEHRFRNPYDEPFEFICNIMNPEKYK